MNRDRGFYRMQREKHIKRKKDFIRDCSTDTWSYWNYKYDGVLNKGKIHCSCWMCASKTSIHGYGNSDTHKITSMGLQLDDDEMIGVVDSHTRSKWDKFKRAG